MKKLIWIVLILVAAGAGGAVFYANRPEKEPTVNTLKTSRGSIVDVVGATGTLTAVTTVTVGTQVSGIVQSLENVDFNSIVKKGQVIARLDPSILETQVETAKANLTNAQANLERQKVAVGDAQSKLARAKELSARQLINKVDLENAEVAVKSAEAQLRSTASSIVQAQASVNKAQVDLNHTIITAPIDGIIIKRSVDRGQTVNAGMSAPELFIIAADLTKMQVNASIDESDVGRMRPGQVVTFRVDAYPQDTFHGSVKQVRLNPVTVQNVVTYSTVIDVPNPELKLKPGMTANVTIEIARRDNVLRVPNAAIRFRPTKDIFEALNQTMPPELERGFGGRGGPRGGQGQPAAPGAAPSTQPGPAAAPPAGGQAAPTTPRAPGTATAGQAEAKAQATQRGEGQQAAAGGEPRGGGRNREQGGGGGQGGGREASGGGQGGGREAGGGGGQGGRGGFSNMTPEERQKRMEERRAAMTPEERAAFDERMKQRQAQGGGPGGFGGGGRGQGGGGNFGAGGRGGQGGGGNFSRGGSFGGNTGGGAGRRNAGEGGAGRTNATAGSPAGNSKEAATTSATTIDALFAPLPPVETRGRVWLYINKQLKSVNLRLGITDGTFTEVLNDTELQPDVDVVTAIITPEMASRPANQNNNANNPLMPAQRGRGPGGPGGGGGGGGRGGGR